ncbi:MAG: NADH dehydrogenase subunit, partial [Firmicutes bacterium]|nr:NADH dehydrogenase subunit [Bacillota bacterium]
RRDITKEDADLIRPVVDQLTERVKYYIELVSTERTLAARMLNVGRLSHEDALAYGASGPVSRAADIPRDTRRDDPYSAYGEVPFDVITDDHADVYGRAVVRVKELMESFKIIRYVLDNMPEGPLEAKFPRKVPAGEAISRYEAPRGEDVHYVKGNGTDKPERVKVRAPTLANSASVALMLQGGFLADVPIVIAAIDPCFSCTDRMVSVQDVRGGQEGVMDWESLRRYSIDWYRDQGIGFDNR